MSKFTDFCVGYRKSAVSSKQRTLQLLERTFVAMGNELSREKISVGKLTFFEFSNWLARKFGVTTEGRHGWWPMYEGDCWNLIREKIANEKEQYDSFLELFDEFSKITTRRCRILEFQSTTECEIDRIERLEVWKCSPNEGYLRYLCFGDGFKLNEGFYFSLDDLLEDVSREYSNTSERWTVVEEGPP